jgi:hypothetical protein
MQCVFAETFRMNQLKMEDAAQSARGDEAIASWIILLFSPLAVSAVVIRAAIYGSFSFEIAARAFVAASTVVVALFAVFLREPLRDLIRLAAQAKASTLCIIAASCVMASAATTCVHRSDLDDAIYLPKIMHYVAFPRTVMDGKVYEIANAKPFAFPRAAAPYYPTAYEFVEAATSYVAGVDFLSIYYIGAPFIVGLLGALCLIICLRSLGISVDQAACATLLLIPLMLLMGETHRSFGNVTLLRAFQAKFVFFIIGLPLFSSVSIAYFRNRNWSTWSALGILTLALGGVTTSALVMLPLLALLLSASWWLTHFRHQRHPGYLLIYGVSLAPVIVFAIDFRRFATAWVQYGSTVNAGFPDSFWGQFKLVYTDGLAPISLMVSLAALTVCLRKAKTNAFILTWSALAILALLNPVLAPWIMRHLTTENIYWRLFYLLPMPLLWGTAYVQLVGRFESLRTEQWLTFALATLLIGLSFIAPTSTLRSTNGTTIGWPGYSLDDIAPQARQVLSLSPDGVMLAPIALAQDVAILAPRHSLIATREDFLQNVLHDQRDEYQLRSSAAKYAAGDGGRAEDLITVIHRNNPSTVVLVSSLHDSSVLDELTRLHFHPAGRVNDWMVYVRS